MLAKNKLVAPVVKWVGGKRQLLDEITPLLPKRVTNYCEPFLGGGAVLFSIQPSKAIVNDLNADLITVYEVIRDDVEALIEPVLRAVSKYFNTSNITFYSEDFAETLSRVHKGGFVYLDPPYDPVSDTASFTGYNKGGFDRSQQLHLKR